MSRDCYEELPKGPTWHSHECKAPTHPSMTEGQYFLPTLQMGKAGHRATKGQTWLLKVRQRPAFHLDASREDPKLEHFGLWEAPSKPVGESGIVPWSRVGYEGAVLPSSERLLHLLKHCHRLQGLLSRERGVRVLDMCLLSEAASPFSQAGRPSAHWEMDRFPN